MTKAQPSLDVLVLAGLRAALEAGASPAAALAECAGDGVLGPVARAVRLGQPLAEAAAGVDTGDPAADLLIRALGVAERAGAGALAAVEQALDSVRDAASLRRLLQVRTAQARGTAVVLTALPVLLWVVLMVFDRRALGFYRTLPGIVTGALAGVLVVTGHRWSRRIVAAATRAADAADPLTPRLARPRYPQRAAVALAATAVVGLTAGPAPALVAGLIAVAVAARRTRGRAASAGQATHRTGGAAEAVELVAVAVASGLPPSAAVAVVAPLAPPHARAVLAAAARRLSGGWAAAAAFADTGLSSLGAVLATAERWGAPAGPALRRLAADLRADARAAAEEAAEKIQLQLVFPTTLLTLPAFVLGVVPPLLWAALAGASGLGPPS